ncbi:AAA family ATPase [Streptomyces chartreusis]|uniref:AAA family ATPase n=1 Tax=Streptomyces chartreusis TaxID=1969 RepID=UPI0033E27C0E
MIIAVDDYATGDEAFTAGIQTQVETVTRWLAHPSMDAERRFEVAKPDKLFQVEDVRAFLAGQELARAEWDEALVVYVTGHGLRGSSQRHYLTFASTEEERLLATAFPTSELVTQVMDSEAEHVLVLVDSCFSGSLKNELGVLLDELNDQRRRLATLAVITSGDFQQQPRLGEFTRLLSLALEQARDESSGFTASHLSLEEWEKLLNTVGDDHPDLVRALWVWPDSRRGVPALCLPNPHFAPRERVVEAAREPVALSASALDQYWLSRASGRIDDEDPGWYFSGREDLMRSLVKFVGGGEGVLIVTGAAGSGKSALLARLVTLSDPVFVTIPRFVQVVQAIPAPLRPAVGGVDAAVLARGKSSLALIEDLLAAFGGSAAKGKPALQALLQHLAVVYGSGQDPVTIVVDGLDEAQEPVACLSDVIAPLARLRLADGRQAVRMVLGMRSSARDTADGRLQDAAADQLLDVLHLVLEAGVGEADVRKELLRTDGPQTTQDISAYVQAVLEVPADGPYADEEEAAAAAGVIAQAVAPSFLDARLAAAQLRAAYEVQDLTDPLWRGRMLAGTTALLSSDLREVARHQDVELPVLLAVLRVVAFGRGTGLPWAEVWPAAAAAVLGEDAPAEEVIDAAIRTVRHSRLVGYLTTSEEDARVTYRPVHQRVAEVLMAEPSLLAVDPLTGRPEDWAAQMQQTSSPRLAHRAVAKALAQLARRSGHLAPHPYVRRHTVAHADQGGILDDSVMPVELAARESSGTLRGRVGLPLPFGRDQRQVITAAGLIEPYLDESVDVPSRFSSIRFHLAAQHQERIMRRTPGITSLHAPSADAVLHTRWVHWRPRGNVVAAPAGRVHAICALRTLDGRSLLATSTRHGLGIWDSTTGQQLVSIDNRVAHSLNVARGTSGRPFLVAAEPTSASVFDPLSGRRLARLDKTSVRMVAVARDGHAPWTMVVASGKDLLVWQPSENEVDRVPLPENLRLPERLTWVRGPDGQGYHVCKRYLTEWVLFDPLTGDILPLQLPSTRARSLTAIPRPSGGDLLAFVPGPGGPVQFVDPFGPDAGMSVPCQGRRVVALDAAPDGAIAVGVVTDDAIEVWDLATGEPQRRGRYRAQPHSLFSSVVSQDGSWRLVVTGDEGIRLQRVKWRGRSVPAVKGELARPWSPVKPRGMTVLTSAEGAQHLAVASRYTVNVLHPDTGVVLHRYRHDSQVTFLESVPGLEGGEALVVGDAAGLHIWRPNHEESQFVTDHRGATASCCTVRLPNGEPALVVATPREILTVGFSGDLRSRVPTPNYGYPPTVSTLVALPSPDGRSLVAGTCRSDLLVWDVASGALISYIRLSARATITALCVVGLPENRFAVAASTSREVTLWDVSEWKPVSRITTPSTVVMQALPKPSGACLLATGNGTGMRLWEPLTGQLMHTLLTAAPVASIACTRNGTEQHVHIGGPPGIATLTWPLQTITP